MTPEQFAYWLQGFNELTAGQQPTPEQWKSITEHLKTVFVKVTPALQVKPSIGFPLSGRTRLDDYLKNLPASPYVITC